MLAVEAWAELGVVPADDARRGPRAGRVRRRRRRTNASRSPITTSPRSSTSCRSASARPRRVGALRPHVERRRRHRARAADDPRRSTVIARGRRRGSRAAIAGRAREFRDTPMVGRTHGIHAEPTTFGVKLALWAMQVRRDRERLAPSREGDRRREAVGRGRHVFERRPVRRGVRVRAPRAPTGARRRRCSLATATPKCMYACASLGATIESFALEIRHLQRTEVREVEEPFREGEQKGSSAMPHKRNPVKSEQLCGLARVLRGNLQAALENVALWHERDISHSSVERVIVPDSLMLAYYMTVQFTRDRRRACACIPTACCATSTRRSASCSASRCCWRWSRRASRATTRTASCSGTRCGRGRRSGAFREILGDDPDVTDVLDAARLDAGFDLKRALSDTGRVFDALDTVEARASTGRPTSLPHLYTGKVRELYEVGHDRMLMVASDRVSVFDVVLPDQIPDKGRVLTGLSHFWFERTPRDRREPRDLGRPHRLPGDGRRRGGPGDAGALVATDPARVRRARLPVRRRLAGVPRAWHRRWLLGARGLATGRAIAGAFVHTDDQGGVGSRRPGDARRSHRTGRRRALRSAARAVVAAVRVRRRVRARLRRDPRPTRSSSSARSTIGSSSSTR